MDFMLWIAIGVVIGWAFPQPEWAKGLVDKVKGWFGKKAE